MTSLAARCIFGRVDRSERSFHGIHYRSYRRDGSLERHNFSLPLGTIIFQPSSGLSRYSAAPRPEGYRSKAASTAEMFLRCAHVMARAERDLCL